MHSKSNNIEIVNSYEADEAIKELFDSLKNRYQIELNIKIDKKQNLESIKGSEIFFDYVHLLYYNCHNMNPNHGRSYLNSLDWIKNNNN